jgi:hypothetical protein
MTTVEPTADAAGSLDMLLTEAALGTGRMLRPDLSTLAFLAALADRPGPTLGRVKALAGELARIARGTSEIAPGRRDRRFADPAWTENRRRTAGANDGVAGRVRGGGGPRGGPGDVVLGTEMFDAVCTAAGAERVHLLGTCSGGIVSALVAGHLAAIGQDRLASFTLLVTMLDQERAGTAGAFADPATARTARGSWWPDFVSWLKERGGEQMAPSTVENAGAAPGHYVLET